MFRPPPNSPFFPHTPLFRSQIKKDGSFPYPPLPHPKHATGGQVFPQAQIEMFPRLQRFDRSEEHTSELQSRSDLVCRLLLEKKKTMYMSDSWQTMNNRKRPM